MYCTNYVFACINKRLSEHSHACLTRRRLFLIIECSPRHDGPCSIILKSNLYWLQSQYRFSEFCKKHCRIQWYLLSWIAAVKWNLNLNPKLILCQQMEKQNSWVGTDQHCTLHNKNGLLKLRNALHHQCSRWRVESANWSWRSGHELLWPWE